MSQSDALLRELDETRKSLWAQEQQNDGLRRRNEELAGQNKKLQAALREARSALWTVNVQFISMHHATVIHGVPESPEALKKECRQGMADCHPALVAIDAALEGK